MDAIKQFLIENWVWITSTIGGLLATLIASLKATVIKVNKLCLEYEQESDQALLAKYNDNPNSKNKQGYTEHQRANALRERLVITQVKKSLLFCPTWIIKTYIKSFCTLNKFKKLEQKKEEK